MNIKINDYKINVDNTKRRNINIPKKFLVLESIIDFNNPRKKMLKEYSKYLEKNNKQQILLIKLLKKQKEITISCGCNIPYKCHGNIMANEIVKYLLMDEKQKND